MYNGAGNKADGNHDVVHTDDLNNSAGNTAGVSND